MLLTTQRMPLFSKLILSIRAHCLSVKEIEDTYLAQEFCKAFALHTTRFNTSLRFSGLGLTKLGNERNLRSRVFDSKLIDIQLQILDTTNPITLAEN